MSGSDEHAALSGAADDYVGPFTMITLQDGTKLRVRGHADDIRAKVSEMDAERSWERNATDDGWTPSV